MEIEEEIVEEVMEIEVPSAKRVCKNQRSEIIFNFQIEYLHLRRTARIF